MTPAVRIARGASYLIVNDVATTIAGVLSFAVIVRLLTPAEIGIMAALLLVLDLCQTLVGFGLPAAMTKFVAQSDNSTATHIIRVGLRLVFVCSVIAGVVTVFLSGKLSQYLSGTLLYALPFALLGVAIISAGLYDSLTAVLMGRGRIKELATLDAARFILQQALAVGLVVMGWRLVGVMTGWMVGYVFFALVGYLVANGRSKGKASDASLQNLLEFSAPLYVGNLIGFAYSWMDRALLLLFVPLYWLGIYNVAFIGFGIVASIPGAIGATLFPHYSKLSAENRRTLEDGVFHASRYIALVVSPLALGLAALAPTALRIIGGPAYQSGAVALAILSVSLFATLSSYALGSILVAINRPRQTLLVSIVPVLVSLMSGVALIPILGINGSALARGLGMGAGLVATILFVKREIALRLDRSAILKSAVAGVLMAFIVLCVEVVMRSVFLLPAYILTGVVVYLLVLRLEKAVNRVDIELFSAYAGKRLAPIVERIGSWLVTQSASPTPPR